MKILQINKFLYPQGGTETYLFGLVKLLKAKGHKIFYFSQKNKANITNEEDKYFVANIDLDKFYWRNLFKLSRIFWYRQAAKNISQLIADKKPDLVHIHNIYHQLSPAILPTIKKFNIPIVMSVHDFKLIKSDYTLWAGKNKNQKSWPAKLLMELEFNWHKFLKTYQKNIDLFIAPSKFVRNQLINNGYDQEKVIVLPHFIDLDQYSSQPTQNENYILYFGRLDKSKGVDTLIRAFGKIEAKNLKLKIVGSGPELAQLKKISFDNVEFLGQKNHQELITIIQKSLLVVLPSRVHETFGLAVLESFACGKPVIASNVGAYPELVENNKTGLIFPVDNEEKLTQAINNLSQDKTKIISLGQNARAKVKQYDQNDYYQKIIGLYQKLVK